MLGREEGGMRRVEGVGPPWVCSEEAERRTEMDCLEEGCRENEAGSWQTPGKWGVWGARVRGRL